MRKQLLLGFLAMVLLLFPAHALGTPAEGDTSARSVALSVLEAAFPNESWTDCNPLAWDAAAQDGKQIAAAIIDRAGSRVFYMVDGLAPQTAKVRNAALIPAEAEEGSLHVNCQLLHGQYDVGYIYFELDGVSYTAELSRSDAGVCQLKSIGIYSGSETNDAYWTAVPQGALLTLDTGDFSQAMCIRAPLPDCMRSLETLDLQKVYQVMQQAHAGYLSGEAPIIPTADCAFSMPQPCGARIKPGTYPVYSGPSASYFREADGKACVSTNDWIQVFGKEKKWVLVQYRVNQGHLRFGYIPLSAMEQPDQVPELHFESTYMYQDNQFVTSDPLGLGNRYDLTGDMYPSTRLCTLDEYWMYVELTLPNGQKARMFAEIVPSHG